MKIDGKVRVCAVIGNPVEHSLSPILHNAAFEAVGLDICYVAFRVEDIGAAMAGVRGLNILGLSVTIPHKVAIIPHLDEVDETAEKIGSVNTVLNRDGRLIGSVSDGMGAVRALQEAGVELNGKKLAVLGSGGAARAITLTIAREIALEEMVVLGVEDEECDRLCADIRDSASFSVISAPINNEALEKHIPASAGVIHCTPVGMSPKTDETILTRELLRQDQFVFDIVYTPLRTRLLAEAEAAGCKTIPGVEMFIHQAVFQFELWTGVDAPVECMRQVVMESLER